jgi:DNA-binding NarL/FixJ family response regulator
MDQKANIIIVEDDLVLRRGIEDLLSAQGFNVRGTENGFKALELMREQSPDLILSDIIMPVMNGYQFYHRVRSQEAWLWIPFIFITAKDDVGDVRYGRELGADDYIKKPFEPEDLLAAVYGKLERFDQLTQAGKNTRPLIGSGSDMAVLMHAVDSLSEREREVLMLICGGLSNPQIAEHLVIAVSTVKTHVASILAKLSVGSRTEAASLVLQVGLDCLDD